MLASPAVCTSHVKAVLKTQEGSNLQLAVDVTFKATKLQQPG